MASSPNPRVDEVAGGGQNPVLGGVDLFEHPRPPRLLVAVVPPRDERWRVHPSAIDQRRLLVGDPSERYALEVAGAQPEPPQFPIMVRPGIRRVLAPPRRLAVPRNVARACRRVHRAVPSTGHRAGFVLLAGGAIFLLAQLVRAFLAGWPR